MILFTPNSLAARLWRALTQFVLWQCFPFRVGAFLSLCIFFSQTLFIYFLEKGREGERERNISVCLPFACPILGTWPATQTCALTGNRTSNPLVPRPALNPAIPAGAIPLHLSNWKLRNCFIILLSHPYSNLLLLYKFHCDFLYNSREILLISFVFLHQGKWPLTFIFICSYILHIYLLY